MPVAPPGPPPVVAAAAGLALHRNGLRALVEVRRRYGDVAQWRFRDNDFFLLARADHVHRVLVSDHRLFTKGRVLQEVRDLIGDGLLTSEGDVHQDQRRLLQPAFQSKRLARSSGIVESAQAATAGWRDGQVVDVHRAMTRLALSVVGRIALGADLSDPDEADGIADCLSIVLDAQSRSNLPLVARAGPAQQRVDAAHRQLDSAVERIVRPDPDTPEEPLTVPSLLRGSTRGQTRDQVMTVLLAGHETTASALCWTWALLGQHPDAAARLRAELDGALCGRPPTIADLDRLPYADAVVRESLRLFPPVWRIGRRAMSDYEIDGYLLPERSIVVLSPYVTQRDERYFVEPDAFRPDRWATAEPLPRGAYFPFAGGPRGCIGEALAWLTVKLALATLAQQWDLHLLSRPPRPRALITLRPHGGLSMLARRR